MNWSYCFLGVFYGEVSSKPTYQPFLSTISNYSLLADRCDKMFTACNISYLLDTLINSLSVLFTGIETIPKFILVLYFRSFLLECPNKDVRLTMAKILERMMSSFFQHGGVAVSLFYPDTFFYLDRKSFFFF